MPMPVSVCRAFAKQVSTGQKTLEQFQMVSQILFNIFSICKTCAQVTVIKLLIEVLLVRAQPFQLIRARIEVNERVPRPALRFNGLIQFWGF